jgi:cell division protein FtsB
MNKNIKTITNVFHQVTDPRVLGLLAFGAIALLVTWSGVKVVQTNYDLEKKIAVARQRNSVEQLQNENLKLRNKYFESNQYLELSARRQFGKAIAGEKLYTVPESLALSKTIEPQIVKTAEVVAVDANKPKYQKNFDDWMSFLFQ